MQESHAGLMGPLSSACLLRMDARELEAAERLLNSSPHNREVAASGDALNAAVAAMPDIIDDARRSTVLKILRHLGSHRFTVHNTRIVLSAIKTQLERGESRTALDLLHLMADVFGAPGPTELPAFWDMGVGIVGATGLELPADPLVQLVAKASSMPFVAVACVIHMPFSASRAYVAFAALGHATHTSLLRGAASPRVGLPDQHQRHASGRGMVAQ